MKLNKTILLSAIAAGLSGCGVEEQEYDTLPRSEEQILKSQIKVDQVYLYMPSMARAPKYAVSMYPFSQGEEKLVTLRFDASSSYSSSGVLEIRELNPDVVSQAQLDSGDLGRWTENADATSPVLSIPGDFIDYQCAEDSYGDCTNVEEEVDSDEVSWEDRRYFNPNFEAVEIKERTWDDLFTFADGCLSKNGSPRLALNPDTGWKGYEISDDGSINFELEQDYVISNSWNCMINALVDSNWNMNDLSFTASQFYSLVPLEQIRSKDYEPIVYRNGDENTYGFFTNSHSITDESYISGEYEQEFMYLHRFNPNLEELVYHLSDSFDENEDTQFFKQITIDAIDKINNQLAIVGVPQIRLEEPSGKQPGDLRYNVINLIDEPLSNGLAGYGPSAANPLTGEIVHAHINQYSGVLRSISDWLWDNIATDYNASRVELIESDSSDEANENEDAVSEQQESAAAVIETADIYHAELEHVSSQPMAEESMGDLLEAYLEVASDSVSEMTIEEFNTIKNLERRFWAENNMYPVSELRLGATIKSLPTSIGGRSFDFENVELWEDEAVGEAGKLKEWSELSDEIKAELGIFLAGVYYGKTIVHELGHNLGLRHNFKGSNDEDNYFTQDEAESHGLTVIPGYSSIMDYNPSMLNALPVYGPYDLAALRFGYRRELETLTDNTITAQDGTESATTESSYVSVADIDSAIYDSLFDEESPLLSSDEEGYDGVVEAMANRLAEEGLSSLKEYKFCTDGNVSLNYDCNRHDEGRNVEEIVAYKQERYDDLYYTRVIRGDSANFTEDTISSFASMRIREFQDWRETIQNYATYTSYIVEDYDWLSDLGSRLYIADYGEICDKSVYGATSFIYEYYCSSASAVDDVRNKLIEIILEPDHTCELLTTADDGTESYQYQALSEIIDDWYNRENFDINEVPKSCFNDGVQASVAPAVVTAEVGKYLNSGSAPQPAPVNNYSNYIDYLGSWGEKLAAAAVLVDRVGNRRSTSRADESLADLNSIDEDTNYIYPTEDLLSELILGYKQSYTFTDEEGNAVEPQQEFTGISWDDTIETMPYYGSYGIRQYFGLSKYGETPLIEGILNAMATRAESNLAYQYNGDEDFILKISMREDNPYSDDVRSYTRSNGTAYYATPENEYAWFMIGIAEDYQALIAEEALAEEEAREPDYDSLDLYYDVASVFADEAQRESWEAEIAHQAISLEVLPLHN